MCSGVCNCSCYLVRTIVWLSSSTRSSAAVHAVCGAVRVGLFLSVRRSRCLAGMTGRSFTCVLCLPQPARLNVYKNDSESWDYTNPGLGKAQRRPSGRPVGVELYDAISLCVPATAMQTSAIRAKWIAAGLRARKLSWVTAVRLLKLLQ